MYSFSASKECTDWYVVNDSVMGGVSTSRVKKQNQTHFFFQAICHWKTMVVLHLADQDPKSWLASLFQGLNSE